MEKFRAGPLADDSITKMIPRESKTNAAYSLDSDLYDAMSYVRKSQRQSGLT
jgi:hypothetical protein